MPGLRELLHDAAPSATRDVDFSAVRARVRQRARRRRAAVGGVAIVLLLVIGVAAAAVVRRDDGRRIDVIDESTTSTTTRAQATTTSIDVPSGTASLAYPLPPEVIPRAVLAEFGTIWVGGEEPDGWAVWQLDRDTGEVLAHVPLPGAVRGLAGGENVIWVWGGGDGAAPVGGVGAIDRREPLLIGTFGWDDGTPEGEWMSTYDLAGNGEAVFVSDATHDRVYRVATRYDGDVLEDGLDAIPVEVGRQPTDVVRLTNGSVWVLESGAGTIARIDVETLEVTDRVAWTSGGLVAGYGDQFWASTEGQLVLVNPALLTEGLSLAQGVRLGGLGRVSEVYWDGTYLSVAAEHSVSRYLFAGRAEPLLRSRLSTDSATTATPDGDRVLFVDSGSNAIGAWTPTP